MTTAYLHHKVTVDRGTIMYADEGERLPCVRFVFHPGCDEEGQPSGPDQHIEVFVDPAAVEDLIADLLVLAL